MSCRCNKMHAEAGRPGIGIPARLAAGVIRIYQWIVTPFLGAISGPGMGCRFTPTCSEYARQALLRHGFFYGCFLSGRRLMSCHPWHAGGIDPVPQNSRNQRHG